VTTADRESATPSPAVIGYGDVRGLTDREAIKEPERPVFSKIKTLRLVRARARTCARVLHRRDDARRMLRLLLAASCK